MKYIKFMKISYLILAIVAAVALAYSFFFPGTTSNITRISLLIQSVGFSFVSGLYFGGDIS